MATFWNGYNLDNFLFHGFDVTTPAGFAGIFVGLVSISICYEGLRTLRDFIYARFLTSKKRSLLLDQDSKSSSPPSVRYCKKDSLGGDEGEREVLTGHEIGGSGDAPSFANVQSTSAGVPNRIQSEEEDILMGGDDGSRCKRRLVGTPSPSPYRDTTGPLSQEDSTKRRRELMDLSLSSLLHMIYITVGYTLMLAVMSFNILIMVAVIIGIAIGFGIFGPLRHNHGLKIYKYFETTDPCQDRLLPSQDQSKTESSSTGSDGGGGGHEEVRSDGDGPVLVTGVQVHETNSDLLTTST